MLARKRSPILTLIGLYAMVNDMGGCCCARALLGTTVVRGKVSMAVAVGAMVLHLVLHGHSGETAPRPVPVVEVAAPAATTWRTPVAAPAAARTVAVTAVHERAVPAPAGSLDEACADGTGLLRADRVSYWSRGFFTPWVTVTNRSAGRSVTTCSV